MINILCQLGIIVFGASGLFLIARKNKWGFVIALLAQPIYFYVSFKTGQWGIFISTIFYSLNFLYGIKVWFKK